MSEGEPLSDRGKVDIDGIMFSYVIHVMPMNTMDGKKTNY